MLNYITYLNMSLTAVNNGISKFDSYIEYILSEIKKDIFQYFMIKSYTFGCLCLLAKGTVLLDYNTAQKKMK